MARQRSLALYLMAFACINAACGPAPIWNELETRTIVSLQLNQLPPIPADPSNPQLHNPAAAALGKLFFEDKRFSANAQISCANCHRPEHYFTDYTPRSEGLGLTGRHTPSLLGSAYGTWFYWDGRRDSLWAQALTPLEHPAEHGASREQIVALVADHPFYRETYQTVFSAPPEPNNPAVTFANIGRAIAAYEATLLPQASLFDDYAGAVAAGASSPGQLNAAQVLGLRLFLGKGQCVTCHNGPLFTNHSFHNIGTGVAATGTVDQGRWQGVREAAGDPFNCLGQFSGAPADSCALTYAKKTGSELRGGFKVPGLRNVAATPPYMHDGRFADLAEVVDHYVLAPRTPSGHTEITPVALTAVERQALVEFLHTLTQHQYP